MLLFLLTTGSTFAAQENTVRVQRPNLVVSDMDRALTFYRDTLGLELVDVHPLNADSYIYDIFGLAPTASVREAMFSTPDQLRVFGLTEVKDQELPAQVGPSRVAIVIRVENFDEVIRRSKSMGLKVMREDQLVTVDRRLIKEQAIVDWDGNVILVYAYTGVANTETAHSSN